MYIQDQDQLLVHPFFTIWVIYIIYNYIWVIPNHFNKSLQVTLSELDETWYVSSTCSFMKPGKIPYL